LSATAATAPPKDAASSDIPCAAVVVSPSYRATISAHPPSDCSWRVYFTSLLYSAPPLPAIDRLAIRSPRRRLHH